MKTARDPTQIRNAMSERDLTQRELAYMSRCSHGQVGNVLAGQAITPALARRIARCLRQPVADLFTDITSNDEQSAGQNRAAG